MNNKLKIICICIICIAIILIVIWCVGIEKYNSMKDPYQAFEKDLQQQGNLQQQENQVKMEERKEAEKENSILEKPAFNNNVINILLLGIDSNESRESKRMGYRSDTIIVTSINLDTKEVKMLSIPRDTYTEIPGKKSKDKITHAMAYGGGPKKKGSQYAIEAVENLLKIDIHYYVSMDMDAVKSIVDTIGGVTVDVERNMGSSLQKGKQKLNGAQALTYIRNRNAPTGDFARIKQQQKFLIALFKEVKKNGKLSDVIPLYMKVRNEMFTDLEIDQIGALALFLKDIDSDEIQAFILKGKDIRINGIYYLQVDEDYIESIINEHFLYTEKSASQNVQISQKNNKLNSVAIQ